MSHKKPNEISPKPVPPNLLEGGGVSTSGVWDGGWYVFEDGVVLGPLTSIDTFTQKRLQASGQTGMVSRKGFAQWYPIQSFSEIYSMASGIVRAQGQQEKIKPTAAQRFEPVANVIGPDNLNKIQVAQQELRIKNRAQDLPVPKPMTKTQSTKNLREEREKLRLDFNQQYLQVYSRLRLGRITNPLVGAFLYAPLTLGGYWWAWIVTASQEVSWHLNAASRMNFIVPMWTCLIPGVHLIVAFLLARMVRQMEQQNGYTTVNPTLATVAAICPPLYMVMIQSALNKHWKRHVENVASKL